MREAVLAVDVGGTKTAVALVDGHGVVVDVAAAATPALEGPAAIVDGIARLADTVLDRAGERTSVVGVGVASAGVVDVERGVIVSSTDTLAGWAGMPLAAMLRVALAPRIGETAMVVQNDGDAHALGELRAGAAIGASSMLLVAVGTGVGAAVVVDGRVLRGHRHVAGELGHMPIRGADALRCPCGRFGHLEAIGSGVGMHRHYLALGGDPAVTDARGIVARAASDAVAQRALHESAAAVGRAIAGIVTLLDPELVVLSGGVVTAGDAWWAPMETALRAELIDVLRDIPVVPGSLGDRAPLLGAAASAWELLEGAR